MFELELKPNVDLNNLKIKNAGGSQANHGNSKAVNNVTTSKGAKRLNHKGNQANNRNSGYAPRKTIKSNQHKKRNRKCKRK